MSSSVNTAWTLCENKTTDINYIQQQRSSDGVVTRALDSPHLSIISGLSLFLVLTLLPLFMMSPVFPTASGPNTYFWHNLPLWKVCVKIYFPRQKISFPKLKEAYFSLAIITNKLWELLSSKSMSSRSFFLERVIIIQKGTSTSRRIM